MNVLGVNAVFHDSAAALVVDGEVVAAAEEERFTRRKHAKQSVPFSTWELPERSARWCLDEAGLTPSQLDAVAYSYDPAMAPPVDGDVTAADWEGLRTIYAARAPQFLASALQGLDTGRVRHIPHHIAHAASACMAAPFGSSAVLVADGSGERSSHLAGHFADDTLSILAAQALPHSLGLLYEDLTAHLGFHRSSDEYKVMAMASYGEPRFLDDLRRLVRGDSRGGYRVSAFPWQRFAPALESGDDWGQEHADLAASVQRRLEEVLLELAWWLHEETNEPDLCMAGGVALNCVANSRLAAEGPFQRIWVQPAAGDAGTALGAALCLAGRLGDRVAPFSTAALGRGFSDRELQDALTTARVPFQRPACIATATARLLAEGGVVAWFQGRSEFGPRALGHRSLLASPASADMLHRRNNIKGREQFRPVAPMVLLERAGEIFDGPLPSPFMLFVHRVAASWRDRIPAVVHVDGTARAQTVDRSNEPLMAGLLDEFDRLTGLPVVVNTSLNTSGRPMVDDPQDALECFGSAPIDALAIGPFLARRVDVSEAVVAA